MTTPTRKSVSPFPTNDSPHRNRLTWRVCRFLSNLQLEGRSSVRLLSVGLGPFGKFDGFYMSEVTGYTSLFLTL